MFLIGFITERPIQECYGGPHYCRGLLMTDADQLQSPRKLQVVPIEEGGQ